MPPAKQIHVDRDEILLRIAATVAETQLPLYAELENLEATFNRVLAPNTYRTFQRRLNEQIELAEWVQYDLAEFSGRRDLSESEKQCWRRELRNLVTANMLDADTDSGGRIRFVRLTPSGKAHVAKLLSNQNQIPDLFTFHPPQGETEND